MVASAPQQVVLTRLPWAYLPVVARSARQPVRAAELDGWTVVVLPPDADLSQYLWLRSEIPVITLRTRDGRRSVGVLTRRGRIPGDVLAPGATTVPEVAHPALAQVGPEALRSVLGLPDDDRWFGRVLAALGLPPVAADVAADVAEGRGELPEATVVEPAGLLGTALRGLDLYTDRAVAHRQASRGYARWYAWVAQRPARIVVTAVPEAVLAAIGLRWSLGAQPRPWWVSVVGVGSGVLLADALLDSAFAVRDARRRRRGALRPSPPAARSGSGGTGSSGRTRP